MGWLASFTRNRYIYTYVWRMWMVRCRTLLRNGADLLVFSFSPTLYRGAITEMNTAVKRVSIYFHVVRCLLKRIFDGRQYFREYCWKYWRREMVRCYLPSFRNPAVKRLWWYPDIAQPVSPFFFFASRFRMGYSILDSRARAFRSSCVYRALHWLAIQRYT